MGSGGWRWIVMDMPFMCRSLGYLTLVFCPCNSPLGSPDAPFWCCNCNCAAGQDRMYGYAFMLPSLKAGLTPPWAPSPAAKREAVKTTPLNIH